MNCPDNLKQEAVEKAGPAIFSAFWDATTADDDPAGDYREAAEAAANAVADDLFSAGYEAGIRAAAPAPDEVVVKDAYQRGYEAGRRDDSQQGNRVRIEIDREVARIFAGPDAGVFGPRCFGAQAELTRAVRAALEEKEEA